MVSLKPEIATPALIIREKLQRLDALSSINNLQD